MSHFAGKCHKCSEYGHRMADCPNSKGIFRFECDCGNSFTGLCEGMQGSAKCYNCNRRRNVRPAFRLPKNEMGPRQSNKTHSCNLCHGSGNCPLTRRR
eukprot:TRINITY_DN191_c0_g1_i2.p2 TRINITY_DN191_c0_g1~~TRINITY_DN191_c0_g1_i2.p2  ORF type:complete len:115 (+),score=8.86 TRINITY_DN191_c0_g1_i2:53-346(+)